jgi:hypothetical protein
METVLPLFILPFNDDTKGGTKQTLWPESMSELKEK